MIFSGFRAKFQKRVMSVTFQSNLRKQIRKLLPKFLKFVKSFQFYSILFNRVLNDSANSSRARLQVRGAHGRLDDRRGVGDVARPFQPRRKENRRKHVDVGEISATFCQHFAKLLAFLQTLPIFFRQIARC